MGAPQRQEALRRWRTVLGGALGALEASLAISDDPQQTDAAAAAAAAAAANPAAAAVLQELQNEINKLNAQTQIEDGLKLVLLGAPNAGAAKP